MTVNSLTTGKMTTLNPKPSTLDGFCGQALLDTYTIRQEIGRLDNIKVALVGDRKLSNCRLNDNPKP